MANRQIALLALFMLLLVPACAKKTVEAPPPAPPAKPAPGPKLLLGAEELAKEIGCDRLQLPVLELEGNTLKPERVQPGAEVHHQIIYVFCPDPDKAPEKGTLTRKLTLKGKTVFLDKEENFIVKPGRSAVDAFFQVPDTAPPGTYVLEVDFHSVTKAKKGQKPPSFNSKEILVVEEKP